MTTLARKIRGRPFKPGNRGRPPGSKNKTTQILEQLAEGQAEQLVQKVLEQALAGDVSSQRMIFDRVWPPRKGQPGIPDTQEPRGYELIRYSRMARFASTGSGGGLVAFRSKCNVGGELDRCTSQQPHSRMCYARRGA